MVVSVFQHSPLGCSHLLYILPEDFLLRRSAVVVVVVVLYYYTKKMIAIIKTTYLQSIFYENPSNRFCFVSAV